MEPDVNTAVPFLIASSDPSLGYPSHSDHWRAPDTNVIRPAADCGVSVVSIIESVG